MRTRFAVVLLAVAALLAACAEPRALAVDPTPIPTLAPATLPAPAPAPTVGSLSAAAGGATTSTALGHSEAAAQAGDATPTAVAVPPNAEPAGYVPSVSFTLVTSIEEGRLVFVGKGGVVDGIVNPDLMVNPDDVVQVTLINGDGATHDVSFPDFGAITDHVMGKGASSTTVFRADQQGTFPYFCTLPGHRQAGMEGRLIVGEGAAAPGVEAASIARDPADLPAPLNGRPALVVRIDLETQELEGRLAEGTTFTYWTFNGKVPGPFLRVRQGDTVEVHLKNATQSTMIHSIDLHAVTGPGGGASVMQVPPGQEKAFTFRALKAGLFVYHCATPMVAEHIANGMFGLILVEPEQGLPAVDREFYVMQSEIYTELPFGQHGHQEFSVQKLLDEQPEYVVLNGAVGSLTTAAPLRARSGETVRIYFGVGGPNLTSSFHVIGEIFDRVYDQASLTSPALTDVQTTVVPPGGATVVEFTLEVPGRYILVDHALARLERGLAGFLEAEGPQNPDVFRAGAAQ